MERKPSDCLRGWAEMGPALSLISDECRRLWPPLWRLLGRRWLLPASSLSSSEVEPADSTATGRSLVLSRRPPAASLGDSEMTQDIAVAILSSAPS